MKNKELKSLIHRYFRGELLTCEYIKLNNYLKNMDNLKLFDHEKRNWEQNPEITDISNNRWNFIQSKIEKEKLTIQNITRKLWFQISATAAILLIGLLIGSVISHYFTQNSVFENPIIIETPRGEKSMVTLSDGSQVWLNANSKLICSNFTSNSRKVELSGEAFFKVAHNKNAPFRVKTNECEIEVLGTEFNVMAYDDFGRKEITLLSGKINVYQQNRHQVLVPGEAIIIKNKKSWITQTDASHASAWIDNKFDFQDISLSELIKRLENWYDIDIKLVNKKNKEVNFTGTFKNEETIWQVLDAIKIYIPIDYEKTSLRKIQITVN